MLATTLTQSRMLWYVMRASGLVAVVLLTLTMVAGIVNVRRFATPRWPRAVVALLHRNVSLLAVVFLGVHVATAIVDTYVSVGWLAAIVPLTSHWDRFWVGLGTFSVDMTIALIVTSLLRSRLSHRAWRAVHWLAYASWPFAIAHGLGAGTDSGALWAEAVYAVAALAVVVAVGWRLRQTARPTLTTTRRPTLAAGARS
jgi:predicted ferric reductase